MHVLTNVYAGVLRGSKRALQPRSWSKRSCKPYNVGARNPTPLVEHEEPSLQPLDIAFIINLSIPLFFKRKHVSSLHKKCIMHFKHHSYM